MEVTMKANYRDELDALNALIDAVNRNNELLEQVVVKEKKEVPVITPVHNGRQQRRVNAK
jgi:hypothetical protein